MFWVLNNYWGKFSGWDIKKNIFDPLLIFSIFSYIFKFKGQKNLESEHFGNLFDTLAILILKWPGISKIYQPILDYRMLCVLSNDHLFFGSSHGTPSRILIMVPIQFMAKFKSTFFKLKNWPSEGILCKSFKFLKVNISNTEKTV